jgi:tetratricopeptide (TPR) repeat protein
VTVAIHRDRAACHRGAGIALDDAGRDPGSHFADAVSDFTKAIELDPAEADLWGGRAEVRRRMGKALGRDGIPVLDQAIADYAQAIKLQPTVRFFNERGIAHNVRAGALQALGKDPIPEWQSATDDFTAALGIEDDAVVRANRADMYWKLADVNQDVLANLDRAIADYGAALKLRPAYARAWKERGVSYRYKGNAQAAAGQDPAASYRAAVADFSEAIKLTPGDTWAWNGRGLALYEWAVHLHKASGDPAANYQSAAADLSEAIKLDPRNATACANRGLVHWGWAAWVKSRGSDASSYYRKAIADFTESLKIRPGDPKVTKYLEDCQKQMNQ